MALDIGAALTTFSLVFLAELPDKTFVATLVLATRLRPLGVWIGVVIAFAAQCAIAVTAGGLLTLLPQVVVLSAATVLFAVGAVVLIRGGLRSRAEELAEEAEEAGETERELDERGLAVSGAVLPGMRRSITVSAVVLFAAEWGDLSQLLTAGLAARYDAPASVFLGSWLALATVAALAVLAGGWLTRRVPLGRIRLAAGGVLSVLAVLSAIEAIRL
jgi:putative Ca2+/H+ antiporter (TMEM165/GDT1 family)